MKDNELPLGKAIEKMLHSYHLNDKIAQAKLVENWEAIAGKLVNKYTKELKLIEHTLYVYSDSASLKHELTHNKALWMQKINDFLETNMVREIITR